MRYVAEIPVRLGSKRVPKKNLRLICGKPMVAYAIEACKGAKKLSEIYVNSESDILQRLAEEYGVKFYLRKPELAEDHIVNDQFNYDFMCNIEMDVLVMINPVSPLVTSQDIDDAIMFFENNDFDSVISVREEKLQSFFRNQPINFSTNGLLPMTQNLDPIQLCSWTVCLWKATTFKESYKRNGYATFSGKVGLFPFDPVRSLKISTESDFKLAEMLLSVDRGNIEQPEYYV